MSTATGLRALIGSVATSGYSVSDYIKGRHWLTDHAAAPTAPAQLTAMTTRHTGSSRDPLNHADDNIRRLTTERLQTIFARCQPIFGRLTMPFARIDLARGKSPEYRATVGDVVYEGIVGILKAPDGDRFQVIAEHAPENFVFDPSFLGIERSPDLIYIQVTSTVGNTKEQKLGFFRQVADELNRRLGVRREDVFISLVFVDREDWSFGNGEPW